MWKTTEKSSAAKIVASCGLQNIVSEAQPLQEDIRTSPKQFWENIPEVHMDRGLLTSEFRFSTDVSQHTFDFGGITPLYTV